MALASVSLQSDRTPRTCSESVLEYLIGETIRYYREKGVREASSGAPVALPLEEVGVQVGKVLGERLSHGREPMVEVLDIMKWICKEFWNEVFLKGIDNLRTNHKGTFVLRDTQFRWTQRLSQNVYGGVQRIPNDSLAADYLAMPCGILKGVLASFGLDAEVSADPTALPQCDFTIVIHSN